MTTTTETFAQTVNRMLADGVDLPMSEDVARNVAASLTFRIGLRMSGQRMAQTVIAANVDEAIAKVRVGAWANASVASVSCPA